MKKNLILCLSFLFLNINIFGETVYVNPIYIGDNIAASFGNRSVNSKTYKNAFVYQDKLWLCVEKLGEYNPSSTNAWKRLSFYTILNSKDGTNWDVVGRNLQIGNRPYVITEDRVYTYNGKYSTNCIDWKGEIFKPYGVELADYALTYFNGKVWVIGGLVNNKPLSVVWSSADGVNWSRIPVPWKGRLFNMNDLNVFVYNKAMWLYGGRNEFTSLFMEDSWRTTDGANWQSIEYIGQTALDNLAKSTMDNRDIFYRIEKDNTGYFLCISANGQDWIKNEIDKTMTSSPLWASYAENTLRGYNHIVYFNKSLWIFGFDFELLANNYKEYLDKGSTKNWNPSWQMPKNSVLVASLKYNVK